VYGFEACSDFVPRQGTRICRQVYGVGACIPKDPPHHRSITTIFIVLPSSFIPPSVSILAQAVLAQPLVLNDLPQLGKSRLARQVRWQSPWCARRHLVAAAPSLSRRRALSGF